MLVVFVTIAIVALAMGGMALGVALTGRRLKGSCGGEGSGSCHCEQTGVPVEQRACEQPLASLGRR